MHKVDIMYEIEPEYIQNKTEKTHLIKHPKEKNKTIEVSDRVFELMLSEGVLQKTDDGYVFVAKYEEVAELKKKKKLNNTNK